MSPTVETHNRFTRWVSALLAHKPTHARRQPVVVMATPVSFKSAPAPEPVDIEPRKLGAQPTPEPTHADPTGSPQTAREPAVSRGTVQPVLSRDGTSVFGVDYDGDDVPIDHQRRSWMTQDGTWHLELEAHHQKEHAERLLAWVQEPRAQILDFPELLNAYCEMCSELAWIPHSWVKVARHFTPLSGGKQYRQALDNRTGRKSARERIYIIPPARPAPSQNVQQERPETAAPLRRAA